MRSPLANVWARPVGPTLAKTDQLSFVSREALATGTNSSCPLRSAALPMGASLWPRSRSSRCRASG